MLHKIQKKKKDIGNNWRIEERERERERENTSEKKWNQIDPTCLLPFFVFNVVDSAWLKIGSVRISCTMDNGRAESERVHLRSGARLYGPWRPSSPRDAPLRRIPQRWRRWPLRSRRIYGKHLRDALCKASSFAQLQSNLRHRKTWTKQQQQQQQQKDRSNGILFNSIKSTGRRIFRIAASRCIHVQRRSLFGEESSLPPRNRFLQYLSY